MLFWYFGFGSQKNSPYGNLFLVRSLRDRTPVRETINNSEYAASGLFRHESIRHTGFVVVPFATFTWRYNVIFEVCETAFSGKTR